MRVGPVAATFASGGLRWVTFHGTEVLRGILLTARDADWRSLVPVVSALRFAADTDRFSIGYDVHIRGDRFDVGGHVSFDGDASGHVDATFTAEVADLTVVQRLGLVVLHPASVAGRPFEVVSQAGAVRGAFPVLVTAERFATAIRSMHWDAGGGRRASLAYEGDAWEIEDQRAWSDASFKSYSPSLDRPHPVTLSRRARSATGVHLTMTSVDDRDRPTIRRARGASPGVTVYDDDVGPVPPIGLGWVGPLATGEVAGSQVLRPAHLRVVVDWTRAHWQSELHQAGKDAAMIGSPLQLELVAFSTETARDELIEALGVIDVRPGAVLAFGTADDAGLVTSIGSEIDALRARLRAVAPGIEVGGGSRANYAELAGADVPISLLDSVAFCVTPQIHATDAATVIENLATLPVLLESAAALARGRPLDVLGSFRPRFDAYSAPAERRTASTRFDQRLSEGLGSAWVVGTLAGLLRRPVGRITILEASGEAAVLTSPALLEILGALLTIDGGHVLRVEVEGEVAAVAIASGAQVRLIVANLADLPSACRIALPTGWRTDTEGRLRLGPLAHRIIDAERV